MESIVDAFGAALVAAMATDTWEQVRLAVVALWRRIRPPQEAAGVGQDLEGLRERVLSTGPTDRAAIESAILDVLRGQFQKLLLDDPSLADQLREFLDETLAPMLETHVRSRAAQIIMMGHSHGNSTFTQVAGDQHNFRL